MIGMPALALWAEYACQGGFKISVDKFVHAIGSEQGIRSDPIDKVFSSDDHSALGTAQKLVSACRNEVASVRDATSDSHFVWCGDAGYGIVNKPRTLISKHGHLSAPASEEALEELTSQQK